MPAPVLTPFAQGLYDSLGPLAYDDANQGYSLAHFCAAIAKMFDQVNGYASFKTNGTPGWGAMMNADLSPPEALPWLAQFVGVQIPSGSPAATARQMIHNASGFRRGTPTSIINSVKDTLIGGKHVSLQERDEGFAYRLVVVTYTADTPSPAATLAAILAQKPAGIVLTYVTAVSEVWDEAVNTWNTAPVGMTWDTATTGV